MARKLIFAFSLVAVLGVLAGCKEDSNTSVKFDPSKGMYDKQKQYKGGTTESGAAATTTKE